MRLLIDLDGVCADFYTRIAEWYNRDYDDNIVASEVKAWHLASAFPKATKEELYSYFNVLQFWTSLDPLPGCVETMARLKDAGHELVIVTALPRTSTVAAHGKLLWVDEHLPFVNGIDNFVATRRKDLIRGDLLFDDGPHNIIKYPGTTCVMDAPYNRKVYSNFRVHSWAGFEKVVEGLK